MYKVESDFECNGLRCMVTFGDMGYRCGYVGIPKTHILYGRDYNDYLEVKKEDIEDKKISGVFPLLGALLDEDERFRIDAFFNCHGGITYAGGGVGSKYPVASDLWWFGFDCAHYDDGKELDLALEYFPELSQRILSIKQIENMYPTGGIVRSREYVENELKDLATQLSEFTYERGISKKENK